MYSPELTLYASVTPWGRNSMDQLAIMQTISANPRTQNLQSSPAMAIPSAEDLLRQENTFNELATLFGDDDVNDVAPSLKEAIARCESIEEFEETMTKKFVKPYHNKFKENKKKCKLVKLIFQTLCVLIVSKKAQATEQYFQDVNELSDQHPSFRLLCAEELILLLKFRNMVRACLCVMNGKGNKQTILNIAGRLEGTQEKYITGSGQRNTVKHRVAIYRKESGVVPEVRGNRRLKGSDTPGLDNYVEPTVREGKVDAAPALAPAFTPAPVQKKRKTSNQPPLSPQENKRQAVSGAFPMVCNLESSGSYGDAASLSREDAERLADLDRLDWDGFLAEEADHTAANTAKTCVEEAASAEFSDLGLFSLQELEDCDLPL